MEFLFGFSISTERGREGLVIYLNVAMSEESYEKGGDLYYVPLPNMFGTYTCLEEGEEAAFMPITADNVQDLENLFDEKIKELISDFWSGRFISINDSEPENHPDYTDLLEEWQENSKTNEMAALDFDQIYECSSHFVDDIAELNMTHPDLSGILDILKEFFKKKFSDETEKENHLIDFLKREYEKEKLKSSNVDKELAFLKLMFEKNNDEV